MGQESNQRQSPNWTLVSLHNPHNGSAVSCNKSPHHSLRSENVETSDKKVRKEFNPMQRKVGSWEYYSREKLMDQRCPQANRSVHITEAKIEVPAVLKPSHSLRFGMPGNKH